MALACTAASPTGASADLAMKVAASVSLITADAGR